MPNHLAQETSPYLLQHQNNPVDWHPWGPEAIELAARFDWFDNPHELGQRFYGVTAGVNVYAVRQYLKLQALYTHKFHYGVPAARPEILDDVLLFAGQLQLERLF